MVEEETLRSIENKIEQANEALQAISYPYKLNIVKTEDLVLLDKNARCMKSEKFQQLVSNIKRDGGLSSIPYCWKRKDGTYLVLSGNHRVEAAVKAGIEQIPILYTDMDLEKDEQIAIQLSHNELVGEDDPIILKELYDEISTVEMKRYSGLEDKLDAVQIGAIFSEVSLEYMAVGFVFLKDEAERIEELFKEATSNVRADSLYLSRLEDFDRLMEALVQTQDCYNVSNAATSLMLILDIFEAHKTDLAKGWEDAESDKNRRWVHISSLFGTDRIPPPSARVILQAVRKMENAGDVTKKNLWQAMEYMAAEYLAGDEATQPPPPGGSQSLESVSA